MNRYQAQAFISEVRDLLFKAANADEAGLSSDEERRLIELEADGLQHLREQRDQLRISALESAAVPPPAVIQDDEAPPADPYANIRLEAVVSIEEHPTVKLLEIKGSPVKVQYNRYIAHGAPYQAHGREVHDSCTSDAEGFIWGVDGVPVPFGAASALAARLLEPLAAGQL